MHWYLYTLSKCFLLKKLYNSTITLSVMHNHSMFTWVEEHVFVLVAYISPSHVTDSYIVNNMWKVHVTYVDMNMNLHHIIHNSYLVFTDTININTNVKDLKLQYIAINESYDLYAILLKFGLDIETYKYNKIQFANGNS